MSKLKSLKPENKTSIWPSWPNFGSKEIESAKRVVRSNQLFANQEVAAFEKEFGKFNNSKYVKGVGNATQGLHLALSALEIGFGDEVIVTSFSWISTASCILMQNATPVFVDIELDTLGADPAKIEKAITKKTKAIIVVHMFGNPCKIKEIKKLASKNKIYLIEDSSHSHGSKYKNKNCGNFSDISVFSVHQRKNLCAGEGGLITSKKKNIDNKIYKLRSFGSDKLSYNYRMTEFSAAIGRVSLKNLNAENKKRNQNVLYLSKKINKNYFKIIFPMKDCSSTFHKLPLLYNYKKFTKNIDFFIKFMNLKGIPFTKAYTPLHHHPNFNQKKKNMENFPNIKLDYSKYSYKNCEEICYKRLTELSIHHPVNTKLLDKLLIILSDYVKKFGK
jgi:dTDP-4-amino-4,6-dideoxygalactose transaminase